MRYFRFKTSENMGNSAYPGQHGRSTRHTFRRTCRMLQEKFCRNQEMKKRTESRQGEASPDAMEKPLQRLKQRRLQDAQPAERFGYHLHGRGIDAHGVADRKRRAYSHLDNSFCIPDILATSWKPLETNYKISSGPCSSVSPMTLVSKGA